MAKKQEPIVEKSVEEKTDAVFLGIRRAVQEYKTAAHLVAIGPERMCPIFYRDEVFYLSLPWADFDNTQQRLLNSRNPMDELFFTQLFDLIPTLKGRVALDIGGFTGLTAMILLRNLNPEHMHIFEPQNTMQEALTATFIKNKCEKKITLHQMIIGENEGAMTLGKYRPDRLADTTYIVRKNGPLRSTSIDSLKLSDVGLINLHYNESKVPAIKGAMETIKKHRPLITVDLSGRDHLEIEGLLENQNYTMHRAGTHSIFFLP